MALNLMQQIKTTLHWLDSEMFQYDFGFHNYTFNWEAASGGSHIQILNLSKETTTTLWKYSILKSTIVIQNLT